MPREPVTPESAPGAIVRIWDTRIKAYEKAYQAWRRKVTETYDRYSREADLDRPEQQGVQTFNILWSNIQTELPVVFSQAPAPDVRRRFASNDKVGRVASLIMENALTASLDLDDMTMPLEEVTRDFLLAGRGVPWVRFDARIDNIPVPVVQQPDGRFLTPTGEPVEFDQIDQIGGQFVANTQVISRERAPVEFIHWSDFAHAPVGSWEELKTRGWVGKRVFLTEAAGRERFGPIFSEVPLKSRRPTIKEKRRPEGDQLPEQDRTAEVWELWNAEDRHVYWIALGYKKGPLDVQSDPLGLVDFLPTPRPAYSTTQDKTLVPVPDFIQYRDMADDLEELTNRISVLQKALVIKGVYDSSMPQLANLLLDSGTENMMFPVDEMHKYRDESGANMEIVGPIRFFPVSMIASVYNQLLESREVLKQQIFEMTGMSDIMRGQVDPREALGQSRIKGQFGTLRISRKQREMARVARDALRIKAEIMVEHFSEGTLLEMAGADAFSDADRALVPQALELLRNDLTRNFRIDIESDSTITADEIQIKRERTEFLEAVSSLLANTLPLAESNPDFAAPIGELIMFGVRGFKAGRSVEASLEMAIQQAAERAQAARDAPQGPGPAEILIQLEQARLQLDQERERNRALEARLELVVDAEDKERKARIERAKIEQRREEAHDKLSAEEQRRAPGGPSAEEALAGLINGSGGGLDFLQ